jgi:hypothetical protein
MSLEFEFPLTGNRKLHIAVLSAIDPRGHHHFSGVITDATGTASYSIAGTCSYNRQDARRGRPPIPGKKVAAALAHEYFRQVVGKKAGEADLIVAQHVAGASGENARRDTRKLRQDGVALLRTGTPQLKCFFTVEGKGCALVLSKVEACSCEKNNLLLEGEGWLWREGDKKARFGKHSVRGTTDSTQDLVLLNRNLQALRGD